MEDHALPPHLPEPEVVSEEQVTSSKRSSPEKAARRQFTLRYKRDILEEHDRLEPRERGALLRREGLYFSHIHKWRTQLQKFDRTTGNKPETAEPTVSKARYDALKKQLAEVSAQLEQANSIIAVQKKLSDLLFANSLGHSDENSK